MIHSFLSLGSKNMKKKNENEATREEIHALVWGQNFQKPAIVGQQLSWEPRLNARAGTPAVFLISTVTESFAEHVWVYVVLLFSLSLSSAAGILKQNAHTLLIDAGGALDDGAQWL